MKSDELYVLIGNWRKEMEEVGKMVCVAEMGKVMLELREDMYTSEQKSAGKTGKAILSAAKRIVKSAKATKRDSVSGVFTNIDKDGNETSVTVEDAFMAADFLKERETFIEVDGEAYQAFRLTF